MAWGITTPILAKSSGETLSQHTLRCLKAADLLLGNLPFDDQQIYSIRKDLRFALAMHDVGKASKSFQDLLERKSNDRPRRHEIISASFASSFHLKEEVLFAVLTHHKDIFPDITVSKHKSCLPFEEIPFDPQPYPIWEEMVKDWNDNISNFLPEWRKILEEVQCFDTKENFILSCLGLRSAWLDRNKQKNIIRFENRLYASLLRGLLMSSDHIASTDLKDLCIPTVPQLSEVKIDLPPLYGFQKRVGEVDGNLILRAPTGSGKTIAALMWARRSQKKHGRLFYALPNIASINSMYKRLQKYYGDNVGMLHSRTASSIYSLLEKDELDLRTDERSQKTLRQKNAKLAASLVREMWYPIRVCTPQQILRYTLHGKGWEMMLSEFPNSCFIFDEIHAYNPVTTGLTVATAKYLSENNASCIFLSATLPSFIRKMLENALPSTLFIEPSKNDASDNLILAKKRHNLMIVEGDITTNLESIIKAIENANSTLIICNHVPSAQMVFRKLKEKVRGTSVLLHSRFCRRDRDRIEATIEEKLPKVLVATQVVEVSLDLDFEQAFVEPAPIDALVQRFGRVNRRGERKPANVTIFTKQINKYNIYSGKLTERSLSEIEKLPNPLGEPELAEMADRIYMNGYESDDDNDFKRALNHPLIKDFKKNLIAGVHYDWTDEVIKGADETTEVLPESLVPQFRKFESEGLWIEANRLLVPIRNKSICWLKDYLDTKSDPWLIKRPYDSAVGLMLSATDE